jgi:hypothetical protein
MRLTRFGLLAACLVALSSPGATHAATVLDADGPMALSADSSGTDATEDPPGRVGRLSLLTGGVSLHAPGQEDWAAATVNFPVTAGEALWTDPGAMAEIEVGSTAIRLGGATELEIGRLDDRRLEATLDQGEINIRLMRLEPDEVFDVLTPRGAVRLQQPGRYHIEAGTTEAPTRVESFAGEAVISRGGASLTVHRGEAGLVSGTGRFVFSTAQAAPDALDEWAVSRDEAGPARSFSLPSWAAREPPYDSAPSMPPVSPEMTGAADLAQYGQWEETPGYGAVWYPRAVPVGWAPYRHGHWAWVPPWGWTWIDDAPWGFAPFHYGRWAYIGSRWAWCPGSFAARPVYAPALVAFRGARPSAPVSPGRGPAAAWAPLGPREAYVPWHRASAGYVRRINETAALGAGHVISSRHEARANRSFTIGPRDVFPASRPAMPGAARPSHQAMALGTAPPHLGAAMPGRDPRAMGIPPRPQLPFASPTPAHGWHSPPPEAARLEGRSRHPHEFREAPIHGSGQRHDPRPAQVSTPRPEPPGPRHEGGRPGTAPHGREHGRSQPRPHDAP